MPVPKNLLGHVRIQRAFKARRNGPQHSRSKRIVMLREPERYCQGEPLNLNLDARTSSRGDTRSEVVSKFGFL